MAFKGGDVVDDHVLTARVVGADVEPVVEQKEVKVKVRK
jgi:hypothetical protein